MATKLVFTVQPVTTAVGQPIAPAVQVTAQDDAGCPDTKFAGNVTVAIGANPGGGTLSGTLTQKAVAGIATFNDLAIDKAGIGYTLAATSAVLTGATSAPFAITGAANKLAFTVPPSATVTGVAISPAVQVAAQDVFGNTDSGFAGNVTVAIDKNAGGGAPSGTLTKAAVAGVATFPDLSIDKAGIGYTLAATSGRLLRATSAAFDITGVVASTVNQVLRALQQARSQPLPASPLPIGQQVGLAIMAAGPRDPNQAKARDPKLGLAEQAFEAGKTASKKERRLAIHKGNGQVARVGSAVETEPQVRVTNASATERGIGEPVAGVTVDFTVVAGSGTLGRGSATTDANGIAGPGSWTLGSMAGVNRIEVSVPSLDSVNFIATGVAL